MTINIPTSGVVYRKDDGWYCKVFNAEHGPYPDEADAWWVYENVLRGGNCPTCEE